MLLFYLVGLIIYFVPTIFAIVRGTRRSVAIYAFNILLGWTVIGWIIALIWSLTSRPAAPRDPREPSPQQSLVAQRVAAAVLCGGFLLILFYNLLEKELRNPSPFTAKVLNLLEALN